MAPLLVPVIVGLGASAATAAVIAPIAASVIAIGVSVGLSILLAPQQKKPHATPEQYSIKQDLPARTRIYGTTALGGPYAAFEDYNGRRHVAIVHCEGPCTEFLAWYFDSTNLQLPAGTNGGECPVAPWGAFATVNSYLGTDDQAANGFLLELPYWTAEHQLKGLCYSVKLFTSPPAKYVNAVFPTGEPQLRVVVKGPKVWDPRDEDQAADEDWWAPTTWVYSANPALCILDYLRSPRFGFGVPDELIDVASFAAAATLHDETVTRKDGSTAARYTLGGPYGLDEPPADVLKRMLATCEGDLTLTAAGQVALRGGEWVEPTVTIADPHILAVTFEQGNDRLADVNQLKFSYSSPASVYAIVEGDPWDDEVAQTASGEVLSDDLDLRMVQSHEQGRRLAKIEMHKRAPRWRLQVTTDAQGLLAWGERVIHLTYARLGIDETFLVTGHVIAADWSTCTIQLVSFGAEAYAWDPATEEGTAPAEPVTDVVRATLPMPTGVAAFTRRITLQSGIIAVGFAVTCDLPFRSDLILIGRYRPAGSGDGAWLNMTSADITPYMDPDQTAAARSRVDSPILEDGQSYDWQVALSSPFFFDRSDWTETATITVVADAAPPDSPPSHSAGINPDNGLVDINVTAPGSDNTYGVKVYRGLTSAFASATLRQTFYGAPNAAFFMNELLTPGTYYYFFTAFNRSGAESPAVMSGPVVISDGGGGGGP